MSQVTHRNFVLLVGLLLVIGIGGAYLLNLAGTIPVGPTLPHFVMIRDLPGYSGVGDPSTSDRDRRLPRDLAMENRTKDYVVYEGKLYLKVQETRRALIITTYVKTFDWSQERLSQLVADHPELEVYTK